jgi:DNA-binding transcriptional ArsR family regulator
VTIEVVESVKPKLRLKSKSESNEHAKVFESLFPTAGASLLDFFLVFRAYDYTEAELVRRTHLTPKTVSKELLNLTNKDILKITRKVGRSNMYALNSDSSGVKSLIQYSDIVVKKAYESLAARTRTRVRASND